MIEYAPLQRKWLKHHYLKWQREYAWSAGEFAARVKQPRDALALALGIPLEDFGPAPEMSPPVCADPSSVTYFTDTTPAALPDPACAVLTIEPGVELMPREKPSAAVAPPAPPPPPTEGQVLLRAGRHVIDDLPVEIPGHPGESVWYPLAFGRHTIDNKLVNVPHPTIGFRII